MRQLKILSRTPEKGSPSLEKYLNSIRKYELLTLEEEEDLGKGIKKGDEESLEKLVNSNLRFVVSVAKQYQGLGVALPDLINEGNQGLIKAAHRYDETRGFKFISYAVWWVRQSIINALEDYGRIVKVPQNQSRKVRLYEKNKASAEQAFNTGLEAAYDHADEEAGLDARALQAYNKTVSLDNTYRDSEDALKDSLVGSLNNPDDGVERESRRTTVERVLHNLPDQTAEAIKMFYGFKNETYNKDQIAVELGLTTRQVDLRLKGGLNRLKLYKDELLEGF
ncbi:sigma-70 family RNA polymerase sigma factor [Candidatus Woesearchaeota archaeon]|nr:sigma-70 family RNA polymerase sigma factor [Candidatus Woesearchaeota archaeon]